MNEYQQALTRIIELEDKNAELLEALENIVVEINDRQYRHVFDAECAQAERAIRKAVRFVNR